MKYQKSILEMTKIDSKSCSFPDGMSNCFFILFTVVTFAADVPAWEEDNIRTRFREYFIHRTKRGTQSLWSTVERCNDCSICDIDTSKYRRRAVEMFAVKALREYALGNKDKDNGALLVVTTEKNSDDKRHFYLTTGYGLEGVLPDGKVGRIVDEMASLI